MIRRGRSLAASWLLECFEMDFALLFFFFQAEDGIRDLIVTGVQTCALPISHVEGDALLDGTVHVERRARWRPARPQWSSGVLDSSDELRIEIARRSGPPLQESVGEGKDAAPDLGQVAVDAAGWIHQREGRSAFIVDEMRDYAVAVAGWKAANAHPAV